MSNLGRTWKSVRQASHTPPAAQRRAGFLCPWRCMACVRRARWEAKDASQCGQGMSAGPPAAPSSGPCGTPSSRPFAITVGTTHRHVLLPLASIAGGRRRSRSSALMAGTPSTFSGIVAATGSTCLFQPQPACPRYVPLLLLLPMLLPPGSARRPDHLVQDAADFTL